MKMNSFKSSENQKIKIGPNRSVWNDKFSSLTLNELAMKAFYSPYIALGHILP